MSTQNIPDNELDDFFKKSLEEPHIAFDEEAWAKMEQKMDNAANRNRGSQRLFYALLLLLGAFTGIVSWYILDQKTTPILHTESRIDNLAAKQENASEKNTPANDASPADLDALPSSRNASSGTDVVLNQSKDTSDSGKAINHLPGSPDLTKDAQNRNNNDHPVTGLHPDARKTQPDINNIKKDAKNYLTKSNSPVSHSEKSRTTEKEKSHFSDKTDTRDLADTGREMIIPGRKLNTGGKEKRNPSREVDSPRATDQKNIQTKDPDKANTVVAPEAQETTLTRDNLKQSTIIEWMITPISGPSLHLSESFSAEKVLSLPESISVDIPDVTVAPKDTAIKQILAKTRFKPGFGAAVVVSPDMSSVGFTNWDMPGTNAGFILEYFISGRWSISTGAIYSIKIYKAAGKEYTPPKGFWGVYKIWPEKVDANCKVLDIPLNVKYNIIAREKFNVFAASGLSSYLMLKENYRYTYSDTVNTKYLKKSWSTENEFKHFFAVVNISAGYERKFSNRVSLQAEPYLKIPLAGVGFGKIKLLSTGAFVSLKYRF